MTLLIQVLILGETTQVNGKEDNISKTEFLLRMLKKALIEMQETLPLEVE
jgi:hypothetical protein